ncbi:phosphotransferase family protein [Kitasatospora viridis]|uniref:Aminoglycoside phosphotransferase (APT) family kinase protein n=1 Tax=Kitasatospora viridis TaxID=281105 RepID=A0A561SAB1_9ACTN|nr:phosphotransferase [Kitasatospora viridis]TWF71810.1 aminoglycoside phosphotransferase (APT) family kinase protein [Kitasatospora viridis]
MARIDGRVPRGAIEITTGQANRVWYITDEVPYVLKHYQDPARAANEAAALALITHHHGPGPRLLAAAPEGRPAWTAQSAVQAEPVPVDRFLKELADPLATVHAIPGTHFGRLAGATRHPTWQAYLTDRLNLYARTAPELVNAVNSVRRELDRVNPNTAPRLLHHDLQPGHLVSTPQGHGLLLDWELAAFGDPLSDLARLAVRLHLTSPQPIITDPGSRDIRQRLRLYWRLHLLADAALATDPAVRAYALDLTDQLGQSAGR